MYFDTDGNLIIKILDTPLFIETIQQQNIVSQHLTPPVLAMVLETIERELEIHQYFPVKKFVLYIAMVFNAEQVALIITIL